MGPMENGSGSCHSRDPSKADSVVRTKSNSVRFLAESSPESNSARERLLRSCAIYDHMRRVARIPSDHDDWVAAEHNVVESALDYASTIRARVG